MAFLFVNFLLFVHVFYYYFSRFNTFFSVLSLKIMNVFPCSYRVFRFLHFSNRTVKSRREKKIIIRASGSIVMQLLVASQLPINYIMWLCVAFWLLKNPKNLLYICWKCMICRLCITTSFLSVQSLAAKLKRIFFLNKNRKKQRKERRKKKTTITRKL